jgi:hypothetical protein
MLFKEIIAVYAEKQAKHIHTKHSDTDFEDSCAI